MLRTIIIDDEAHIRDTLSRMLLKYCPQVRLSGEACGVASGIKSIAELQPDLVFLDINLGDGNAFDLLHAINIYDFRIVFISSFNSEAIRGMKENGMCFLQKPFNPFELIEIVRKSELSVAACKASHIGLLEKNLGFGKRNVVSNGRQ